MFVFNPGLSDKRGVFYLKAHAIILYFITNQITGMFFVVDLRAVSLRSKLTGKMAFFVILIENETRTSM